MLGFDRRGDAQRGDFDGSSFGTIAATSAGADLMARQAAVPPTAAAGNPFTGAVAHVGSMSVGLGALGLLLLYAYRRVL
jgi:hypothetical protein